MIVYKVMYGPGEPDGVYTLAICATQERAEQEISNLIREHSFAGYTTTMYNANVLFIEEEEVLE